MLNRTCNGQDLWWSENLRNGSGLLICSCAVICCFEVVLNAVLFCNCAAFMTRHE